MNEQEMRLDGNAAAGVLTEIFAAEMTTAVGTCAHCGATNALGATHVYMRAPGTVIRCPACTSVLVTVVHAGERVLVDLDGTRRLQIAAPRD
jgi:Family of unknown function (DUF6510)